MVFVAQCARYSTSSVSVCRLQLLKEGRKLRDQKLKPKQNLQYLQQPLEAALEIFKFFFKLTNYNPAGVSQALLWL